VRTRFAWAACAALCTVGCGDVFLTPIGGGASDAGVADARLDRDASTLHDAASTPDASPPHDAATHVDASSFCAGHGPIPIAPDECSGDVAGLFRFAACACGSLAVSGTLTTDSFAGSSDAGAGSAGSIAANGQVATNGQTTVHGSVWAGGQSLAPGTPTVSMTSPAGATSTVEGDIRSGGDVATGGTVLVGGTVYADGNVNVQSGSLSVVGAVEVPAGDSASGVTAGGGIVNGAVDVPPPCDCSSPLNVASVVAAHEASNDDVAAGLTPSSLTDPVSAVALPCGLYYVTGIHGDTEVTLDVTGRAALFVDGDLDAQAGLTVKLATGAELDLFVAGNVAIEGATSLNATGAPSNMRVYVGGSTLTLSASATVNANIYAPTADVQLASNFEMSGAFFANALQFSGDFTLHYDTAILQTPGCAPPGMSCTTCDDCPGGASACVAGTCGACLTTADCCAPLECDVGSGRCALPSQ
jgi:hypothetical protein